MKVVFVGSTERLPDHREFSRRTRVERVMVVEDDGTEDLGRTIAVFHRRDDAFAVAKSMGWEVKDELPDLEVL